MGFQSNTHFFLNKAYFLPNEFFPYTNNGALCKNLIFVYMKSILSKINAYHKHYLDFNKTSPFFLFKAPFPSNDAFHKQLIGV